MDEITEQDLKDKGLAYKVDEGRNVYYIEKGVLRKTRDYVYRSFATPVTVTVDVVTPLVVVGGLTYAIMNADGVGHIDFEEFYTWLSGTYDLD